MLSKYVGGAKWYSVVRIPVETHLLVSQLARNSTYVEKVGGVKIGVKIRTGDRLQGMRQQS